MSDKAYTSTPLFKKLGYKDGMRVLWLDVPESYPPLLDPLPEVEEAEETGPADFIHVFIREIKDLKAFPQWKAALDKQGMVWVSWPKQSSPLASDLKDGHIRQAGLDAGLVDAKVCAIDADWSGLKFVYRKSDR